MAKKGLGGLLDDYGRRFHEAKIASGAYGTKERADAARAALVRFVSRRTGHKTGVQK